MVSFDKNLVLLAGDTHGDTEWVAHLVDVAVKNRIPRIVVLGDFGYWVHYQDGREFISDVTHIVADAGLEPLIFVDGNHEYHTTHPAKPEHHRLGLQELNPDNDGWVWITDHIIYAPRGHRWNWEGVRFGALGGAFSIDWEGRKKYRTWWPTEMVSPDDVNRLGTDPLDVLLTHDSPADVPIPGMEDRGKDHPRTDINRERVKEAMIATNPSLLAHGHWHIRYSYTAIRVNKETTEQTGELTWDDTQIEGFGANVNQDDSAYGILNLSDLTLVFRVP